jgi:hypothetical protein
MIALLRTAPAWLLLCALSARGECLALHPSGKRIPVKQEQGETYDAYALASWLPYGPPTIYYGKRYAALTAQQQGFVRRKECAHLSVPVAGEVAAACHALRELRGAGLSAREEQELGAWLAGGGAAGFAAKGTPQAFWDAIARCAQER